MTSKRSKWMIFLSAVLSLTITLGFTGCSKDPDDTSSTASDETSSGSSDVSGEEEPIEIHKVGYIFREKVSDGGSAAQICEQRKTAADRSGLETCYIDGVTLTDFEAAVKKLSEAGCTDIVSCSSAYANVLNSVAKNYMDLNFISFGALNDGINVSAYSETPYQGAYVAGLVANFNSNTKKIGVVADPGLTNAVAVVNAVELGSEMDQDGGATVYAAGAEANRDIEKAIDALIDKGCDVIICYTESNHSADYCEKKGIKFIGCLDYSDREDEYSKMLMYFYCQRDSYFLAQFKSMKMGTWSTNAYMGDMGNGVVNVSPAMDNIANAGTQELIDALVPYLTSGAALVFRGPLKDNDDNFKYLETDIMTDAEIASMKWFVKNAESIGDFREPNVNIAPNALEIKT